MLGLCFYAWAFSSCSEWGLRFSCSVWASHFSDFSYCGTQALGTWVSVVAGGVQA